MVRPGDSDEMKAAVRARDECQVPRETRVFEAEQGTFGNQLTR